MRRFHRGWIAPLILAVLAGLQPVHAYHGSQHVERSAPSADGWYEAIAIVRDIDRTLAFFTEVAGYELVERGAASQLDLTSLGLNPTASGEMILVREPEQARGAIRVLQLETDAPQVEIRSSAELFDTGGIAGLNVRVADMDAAFEKMQAAGWRSYADPTGIDVENFSVQEAIFRGPDGLVIGLIERKRPALGPDWFLEDGRLSRPNNAFAVVNDIDAEAAFFARVLGWKTFLTDKGKAAEGPGPNLYGWPWNIVASVDRHVEWLHGAADPQASGSEGSVALMQFGNIEGGDFSQRAKAPNYGFVALRVATGGDACILPEVEGDPKITSETSPSGIIVQTVESRCTIKTQ